MTDTVQVLDDFRATALEQWTDTRVVDALWVDAWVWLWQHSYADFANHDTELTGANFRQKGGDWLLVVKVVLGDIPHVVFVSSGTPTRCVQKLRKLLREGDVKFFADKYA